MPAYRYGHIIHVLCATKSHFAELNSFSTETDFVEAPVSRNPSRYISQQRLMLPPLQSQFLEQHLFEPRILKRFAFNKTGDCISNEMISKLKGMQELNKGMFTRTQLCFSRL
jgi:Zn-dependent oligopeptidase